MSLNKQIIKDRLKDGIVWREKEAYRRGGKNEDDE